MMPRRLSNNTKAGMVRRLGNALGQYRAHGWLMTCCGVLGACGGGGGSEPPPAPPPAVVAPVLTVTAQSVKNLHLSWSANGATTYKVFEDATGSAGFTQ